MNGKEVNMNFWIYFVHSYNLKAKGQSILENFFQVMKYDLDMKKNGRIEGLPKGGEAVRNRITRRTGKGKVMSSVARQMGTMREVRAEQ